MSVSAVLAALLPVSCSNDDSGADSREIRLSESVATHGTRAISNQLPANGKVCVNIWDGGNAAGTGSLGPAIPTDLYYTANASGGLVRQNCSQPYVPANGDGVY